MSGMLHSLRFFLCALMAVFPLLSVPAQASHADTSAADPHAHMSHAMSGHLGHHEPQSDGFGSQNTAQLECCEEADICTHEQCSMNSSPFVGLMKQIDDSFVAPVRLSWVHDIVAQRDGHRPLLDPPIP